MDYCVLLSCNLNRQSICNSDISLLLDYLVKKVSIDKNNAIRGLHPFYSSFRYNYEFEHDEAISASDESTSNSPAPSRSSSRTSRASRSSLSPPRAGPSTKSPAFSQFGSMQAFPSLQTPPASARRPQTSAPTPGPSTRSPSPPWQPPQGPQLYRTPANRLKVDNTAFENNIRAFLQKERENSYKPIDPDSLTDEVVNSQSNANKKGIAEDVYTPRGFIVALQEFHHYNGRVTSLEQGTLDHFRSVFW